MRFSEADRAEAIARTTDGERRPLAGLQAAVTEIALRSGDCCFPATDLISHLQFEIVYLPIGGSRVRINKSAIQIRGGVSESHSRVYAPLWRNRSRRLHALRIELEPLLIQALKLDFCLFGASTVT